MVSDSSHLNIDRQRRAKDVACRRDGNVFVLDGEVELEHGGVLAVLGVGDGAYFDASVPHRIRRHSTGVSKVLVVAYTSPEPKRAEPCGSVDSASTARAKRPWSVVWITVVQNHRRAIEHQWLRALRRGT
ncbi:cupin domain-containing protein [Nocardia sp. NPDC050378]|uniref:cupin domain-containing protein n=1 Tax=Nocardia sp. NPDC050378 TaxID=3155400 RepID=UPI0033C2AE3B